jgi:hypothetical protein
MNDLEGYLRNITFDELSRILPDPGEMDWMIYTVLHGAVYQQADKIVMSREELSWFKGGEKLGIRPIHSEPFKVNGRRHLAAIVRQDPTLASHMTLLHETKDEIAFAIT